MGFMKERILPKVTFTMIHLCSAINMVLDHSVGWIPTVDQLLQERNIIGGLQQAEVGCD